MPYWAVFPLENPLENSPLRKGALSGTFWFLTITPAGFPHPAAKGSAAKGVWQKSDEKSDRSIRKSDQKVTERVPKEAKKR